MNQIDREKLYSKKVVLREIVDDVKENGLLSDEVEIISEKVIDFFSDPIDWEVSFFEKFLIHNDIEELVGDTIIRVLLIQKTTLTQLVGMVKESVFGLEDEEKIQVTAELIGVILQNSQMISGKQLPWGVVTINANLVPSDEVLTKLENTCYVPPMIEPPKQVKSNRECGYHSMKKGLVLNRHHDMPQAYNAINLINSTPLTIDENILELEIDSKLEPVPSGYRDPVHVRERDIAERTEQSFNKRTKELARELVGIPFYTPCGYDFRGRIYTLGYHIHTQGDDYRRALISLAEEEIINDEIIC